MENLEIAKIRRDGGTQPRAALDETTIAEYAEAIQAGAEMPAVDVFFDGERYWLADGFHRTVAHERAGKYFILALVHQGDRRAAVLFSTGVNNDHGLRRNNADKRRAVTTLLEDPEWRKWSDREIARQTKVSAPFVAELRKAICNPFTDSESSPSSSASPSSPTDQRTVTRAGTTYTMHTTQIGAGTAAGQAFATPAQLQGAVRSWLAAVAPGNRTTQRHILTQIGLLNDVGRDRITQLAEYTKKAGHRGMMGDLKAACGVVAGELAQGGRGAEGQVVVTEGTEGTGELGKLGGNGAEERDLFGGKADMVGRKTACRICGRPLTVPESVANGCGPECAGKATGGGGSGGHAQALPGGAAVGDTDGQGQTGTGTDEVDGVDDEDAGDEIAAAVNAWLAELVANNDLADDDDGKRTALQAVLHGRNNGGAQLWRSLRQFAKGRWPTNELIAAVERMFYAGNGDGGDGAEPAGRAQPEKRAPSWAGVRPRSAQERTAPVYGRGGSGPATALRLAQDGGSGSVGGAGNGAELKQLVAELAQVRGALNLATVQLESACAGLTAYVAERDAPDSRLLGLIEALCGVVALLAEA